MRPFLFSLHRKDAPMKALVSFALIALLVAFVAPSVIAQPLGVTLTSVLVDLPKFGTPEANKTAGFTYDNSVRIYSAAIPMWQFDSIDVYLMAPDSANVTVKVQYAYDGSFTSPVDSSSTYITGASDSLLAPAAGRFKAYRGAGVIGYNPAPYVRLVYDFKATKNHAPAFDATTRFKAWYKGYYRVH
jgi:hypothetical protein